jgi:hypothetical protein
VFVLRFVLLSRAIVLFVSFFLLIYLHVESKSRLVSIRVLANSAIFIFSYIIYYIGLAFACRECLILIS